MLLNDFYNILTSSYNGQLYTTTIELNKAHPVYNGHFPDYPVVPGVCMMMMVQETLAKAMGKTFQLQEAKTVKFLGIVNPNKYSKLTIECEAIKTPDNILQVKASIYADGEVFYKANCSLLSI